MPITSKAMPVIYEKQHTSTASHEKHVFLLINNFTWEREEHRGLSYFMIKSLLDRRSQMESSSDGGMHTVTGRYVYSQHYQHCHRYQDPIVTE